MFQGLFKKMLEMDECELIIKFHDKNQADLMPLYVDFCKKLLLSQKFPNVPKILGKCPKIGNS